MSAEPFLTRLERLEQARGYVGKLRHCVIELAVRGCLITPNSAAVPYVIGDRATEQSSSTRSKRTPPAKLAPPFAIPFGWTSAPLGLLTTKLGAGSTPLGGRSAYVDDGIPFLRSQNIYNSGVRLDGVARIPPSTHRRMSGTRVISNDVLLNITGASIGRCALVPETLGEANVSQHVAIVRLADPRLRNFVHLTLISPTYQALIAAVEVGVSREGLSMKRLRDFPIPLPPLEEQQRIVAKIDQLMALCDELEEAQIEREARRNRLRTATLRNLVVPDTPKESARFFLRNSPRMITKPEHVAGVRQAILDLAVRGRLVPQRSGDEPFIEWRGRSAGKISGEMGGVSPTDAPNPSLVIDRDVTPVGWSIVTLKDLAPTVTSGSRGWAKFYADNGALFVRSQNVKYGHLLMEDRAYVSPPARSEGTRTSITIGDLLVVITGDVGHVAIWDRDLGEAYVSQHVALVKPLTPAVSPWLLLCMMAPTAGRRQLRSSVYGGKPGLNLNQVRSVVIPVPPLPEQQRIVAKVDELMTVCDELEHSLAAEQTERGRLLGALLQGALEDGLAAQPAAQADEEAKCGDVLDDIAVARAGALVCPSRVGRNVPPVGDPPERAPRRSEQSGRATS